MGLFNFQRPRPSGGASSAIDPVAAGDDAGADFDAVLMPGAGAGAPRFGGAPAPTAAVPLADLVAAEEKMRATEAENTRLKAENERLEAENKQHRDSQAAADKKAMDDARAAAKAAAVTAYGQNSPKLAAAQADIDACGSAAEAERLTRAYQAATPAGLSRVGARRSLSSLAIVGAGAAGIDAVVGSGGDGVSGAGSEPAGLADDVSGEAGAEAVKADAKAMVDRAVGTKKGGR